MHIISGIHKNKKIIAPAGNETRPTSGRLREALFNICQFNLEGTRFLDLFAGSGAMGLEALSRGAKQSTFIDSGRECIHAIEKNLVTLNIKEKGRIFCGDVFLLLEKLEKLGENYEIIYADPPYDAEIPMQSRKQEDVYTYSATLLKRLDKSPLLTPGGMLFIEDSTRSQPIVEGLQTLVLKSSRRMGRSVLQQYVKIINPTPLIDKDRSCC